MFLTVSGEATASADATTKELLGLVIEHCQRYCLCLSIYRSAKRFQVTYHAPNRRTKGNGKASASSLGEALATLDHKLLARYQHPAATIDPAKLAEALAQLFAETSCFCFQADFGLAEPAPYGQRFHLSFPGHSYGELHDPLAMIEQALAEEKEKTTTTSTGAAI